MASTSSASIHKSFKYDVFLSFRGEDTRTNFIDHLYCALQQKNIYTYKDDEAIRKGKLIGDELIGSIEDSKLYIIVFSKNYASSSWCLDELVKIMECHQTTEHTAYPVFYDVEPTEVRKQSGAIGEAFAKHENDEAAGKWKKALKEAADLAGWELKSTANGHEAKFIQIVVEYISQQLHFTDSYVDEKLVGMKTRVNDVLSLIETTTVDARIIGIKGMGGAGKTTLARAIFDHISFKFEGKSFVENVREVSNTLSGLRSLQNQVLKDVLNDQGMYVSSIHDGKCMMRKMMPGKKVLVVLDDVDCIKQLEALAVNCCWFKPGSTIIITTRDEQVLVACGVKLIIDVNMLSNEEAICLLCRYAFGGDIPIQGYKDLCGQVVRYAAGLPLTIQVLGSFLCGKTESEWINALERLKTIPVEETLEILELSYTSLRDDYKEIFLNVACIMKGWSIDLVIEALESCGLHPTIGLKVLEQRSLITISHDYKSVGMHDHIEEMGRNIVRRLHPDKPKYHCRLWINEEIIDILANDLGTKATKYIRCYMLKLDVGIIMKSLRNMKELKFFHVFPDLMANFGTECDNVIQYLPNSLRYLHWYKYPLSSLPNTFQGDNLVSLKMVSSEIVQLWKGGEKKVLNKLKVLDLKHSRLRSLDLGLIPNLNTLSLGGCFDLVQLPSLDGCLNLISVDLSNSKLKTVNLRLAVNLKLLYLRKCNDLVELHLPDGCLKLTELHCTQSKLMILDIKLALNLETLVLDVNSNLVELQMPGECPNLITLRLANSKLKALDIGLTPNLEDLDLRNCYDLEELNMADKSQKLKFVNIMHSKLRTLDLGLTPNLEDLDLRNCYDLQELNMAGKCQKLKSLDIMHSKLRTLDIRLTPNLKSLNLNNCYKFEGLHIVGKCQKLVFVDISDPKLRTLDLEHTPNLEKLDLKEFNNSVQDLVNLDLSGCLKFTSTLEKRNAASSSWDKSYEVGEVKSLKVGKDETLEVGPLHELHVIAKSIKGCPVHLDNTLQNFQFEYIFKDQPSLKLNIDKLLSIGLCACKNLDTFLGSIRGLQHLRMLKLEGFPEVPKEISQLESLEELCISSTYMKHIPDSICMLKHLKVLKLSCWFLEKLPEDLGQLECLEILSLSTTKIRHLPVGICMLKHLKEIDLRNCFSLEKLPKEFSRLECLKELRFSATYIKHVFSRICMLKHLKVLVLWHCHSIDYLPEHLGALQCLDTLVLSYLKIKHLPDTICMLKHLEYLHVDHCSLLEKLPKDLDGLESLRFLNLRECKSLGYIPSSISMMKCLRRIDVAGTCISHLPLNIHLLKGLRILASRGLLQSSGFTSEIQSFQDTCFVDIGGSRKFLY